MRRVPAALLKRLDPVEQTRSTRRPRANFPQIMGLDEWEAEAVVSQARLMKATQEFLNQPANDAPPTQQENTQAEHERQYQDHKRALNDGQREYLKHKQEQVYRGMTR